jgi:transcriptional regulator with XRE-family HTH domain
LINYLQMTIGQRFTYIRKFLDMNQHDFAESIGIKQTNVAKIETDKANPTVGLMNVVHKTYQINLNWLISGTGKMREDYVSAVVNEPQEPYGSEVNDLLRENNRLLKQRNEELERKIAELEAEKKAVDKDKVKV